MSVLPATMKAVVIRGKYHIELEDRPLPIIKEDTDVILRTRVAGLCGSDLHNWRFTDPTSGYILGHEIVGEIIEVGKGVKNFKIGDIVAAPFHCCCGICWYCSRGYFSRCTKAQCYGGPDLDGCQAEYFRQPLADSTLFPVPPDVKEEHMLLLSDVLSTGYACAYYGKRLLDEDREGEHIGVKDGVAVVIGCGPVGLCAISSALTLFSTVYACDLNPDRLLLAEKHGAKAFSLDQIKQALLEGTDGRGADAALEVVGNENALNLALDLIRPFGSVSVIGQHIKPVTLSGEVLYGKK
ncbi:hypothetical protein TREMEDRAFT_28125 [Tremella mesenterica DSM 1558]|uniref:uncharacterized protein n=1 Tax=Tremella mesenterica (strain ATCC 24925 / CBS 8224 / DSM 1558 / NBRC 9311 / NRRL Y-6157 / RJB 2259-6 / UBC 559-6) TaxID=578456 RepID=UPI0003F4A419|nr:uncharacterized protein TREMEDRAFT_28125 [Tremella mesenterica DSM 1558]EIW70986.1 hypothetical protein TREMEDRAFT_28125 [Tremella mesenterica DSM 1558]